MTPVRVGQLRRRSDYGADWERSEDLYLVLELLPGVSFPWAPKSARVLLIDNNQTVVWPTASLKDDTVISASEEQ